MTIFVLIALIGVLDFVCVYVFGIHILGLILVEFLQWVKVRGKSLILTIKD